MKFKDEITDNFSKLFVETFVIRYLQKYDTENLDKDIEDTLKLLDKKIKKEFRSKLNEIKAKHYT